MKKIHPSLMETFRSFAATLLLFLLLLFPVEAVPDFRRLAGSGNDDDRRLHSFKVGVLNGVFLHDWVAGADPCSFSGVVCTAGGRVSAVDLSFKQLGVDVGLVAQTLMRLGGVEKIRLSSANVTGSLSAFAQVDCGRNLAELDLAGNSIFGDVSHLSGLPCLSLARLNLSGNGISFSGGGTAGGGGRNLPPALEQLDLSFNSISGDGAVAWILSSGGCRTLKELRLRDNLVSGQIPVAGCTSLQIINLAANNFSGRLPDLGACTSLQELDLSRNKFSGDIGGGIAGCRQLRYLNLSGNAFSGRIPASGFGGSALQYLSLGGNSLQGEVPSSLFASCSSLLEIDFSSNNLSRGLPASLTSCSNLEIINLAENHFSGDLPAGTLSLLSNLKAILFPFNNFSGEFSADLLFNLSKLETLDLSSNSISGSIPEGICRNPMNSLKELYLQNNLFSGVIPATLSNCSELVSLDLSFNFLTGNIPASLGELSHLRDLVMWLNFLHGVIPEEFSKISTLENLILDNNGLTGGIPSGLRNCTNLNWISLSSNLLSGGIPPWIGQLSKLAILQLKNNSFSGAIPPELGDCKSLIWLDLNSNQLTGPIPGTLAKQSGSISGGLISGKRFVYLRNDGSPTCHGSGSLLEFAGIRPEQLVRVPTRHACNYTRTYMGDTHYTFNNNGSIIFLDLSYNNLIGEIPPELGSMFYINVLNIGHNSLTGKIPDELGKLTRVNELFLSHNHLVGPIPSSFSGLSLLSAIDVSNNNLSGPIPSGGQLFSFPSYMFENNSGLCGLPLSLCNESSSAPSVAGGRSHGKQASLVGSVAMGLLFSLFCIFGIIIVFVESRKRRKKEAEAAPGSMENHSVTHTRTTRWKFTATTREALSINLSTFEKPLRKLTFADLLEATSNFHQDSLIGSGGFGDVYKAQLKDGSVVAIKKLIHVSGQGDREFTAEMETIGKIKHRNLVPLLGYCKVGEERLLVYEYMKYGSLDDVLHEQRKNKKGGIKLDWLARRKIAVGAARGLAFLHHSCIPHIIHRDMKSSNVLLDENLEARVSDFGMARLMSAMDTHLSVSTLAGTPGYVPPEYYQSFRCSTKGDVYSFGVVLLELLTGRQPTDSSDFGDNNLVGWVKQHAKLKISDVFDPVLRTKDHPGLEMELLQHLRIACQCLDDRPWRRPTMLQVMAMFKELHTSSGRAPSGGNLLDSSFGSVDVSLKEGPEQKQ